MDTWQLQTAKNKFSEMVDKALKKGPQVVTKHGVDTVVVISMDDYRKLTRPKTSLLEFFRKSPLKGMDIDIARDKETGREVNF